MKTVNYIYPIYDLSNEHFKSVEIILKNNKSVKGQFVRFKVVKGTVEYIYPSEKYCFLPNEYKTEFWNSIKINNGEFSEFPKYIMKLGLNDMIKITIEPALVI